MVGGKQQNLEGERLDKLAPCVSCFGSSLEVFNTKTPQGFINKHEKVLGAVISKASKVVKGLF